MGESLKADGKIPLILEPKQLQEHLILQLPFYTGIFLANELRAIGFYNTFCFSSLRSRDFVPEEMADILGNHYTGCLGCLVGKG